MLAPASKTPARAADVRKAQATKATESTWVEPGNVAMFLRCLRLLDLDRREDWPDLEECVLQAKGSQQNLQQRVKGIEWSLFRLFEIWDPAYTKDKLKAFFPPLAPLQSLNLRAALFRGLGDLKKNGVLGKEAILRKTMLDECKGDKFEEVIRVFAMAVLRKVAAQKFGSTVGYSDALTPPQDLTAEGRARLLPLLLAHSQALRRQLTERNTKAEEFQDQQRHLDQATARWRDRRAEAVAREDQLPRVDPDKVEMIFDHFKTAWTGSDQWLEILLFGGPSDANDEEYLQGEVHTVKKNTSEPQSPSTRTVLSDLNERIRKQELRLEKWTEFRTSLEKSRKGRKREPDEPARKPVLKLDKHQHLHLSIERGERNVAIAQKEQLRAWDTDIIAAMRLDLAGLRKQTGKLEPAHEAKVREVEGPDVLTGHRKTSEPKSDRVVELDIGLTNRGTDAHGNLWLEDSHRPADNAKLVLPSSRGSARSDDGEEDWIPDRLTVARSLDCGTAFSPSNGAGSSSQRSSTLNHGGKSKTVATAPTSSHNVTDSTTKDLVSLTSGEIYSSSPPQLSEDNTVPTIQPSVPDIATTTTTKVEPNPESSTDPPSSPPQIPLASSTATLLERTRQSMAPLFHPRSTSPESSKPNLRPHPGATARQKHPTKPRYPRPSSQHFPVNPFETPVSARHVHKIQAQPIDLPVEENDDKPTTQAPGPTPSLVHALPPTPSLPINPSQPGPDLPSDSFIPRDILFSDTADYTSVFKSRPRVAVSPPPLGTSPEKGNPSDLDVMEGGRGERNGGGEEEEEEGTIEVEVEFSGGLLSSSPVRRKGWSVR